jgi:uncharacterized protein
MLPFRDGDREKSDEQRRAKPPSDSGAGVLDAAVFLADAFQQRADQKRSVMLRLRADYPRTINAVIAVGVAFASTGLMFAYATVLSQAGAPTIPLALCAVLLASTLSSIAGFAFSAICGGMLLRIMNDPVHVVEIMMVCSIAIQSLSVAILWRDIDAGRLLTFLFGGVIGLPFGAALLLHLEHAGFKEALGGLLTIYAGYVLLKRPMTIRWGGRFTDSCIGFLGGLTGGLAGFPGAPVTIWCGMRDWDKRTQRGIYQPFILIMHVLALVLIHFMRAPDVAGGSLQLNLLQFVPAAMLGTWFGMNIFRRMTDRVFALSVNFLLLASGIGLLI